MHGTMLNRESESEREREKTKAEKLKSFVTIYAIGQATRTSGRVPSAATPAIILIYISTLSKLNPHVSTRNWVNADDSAEVREGGKGNGGIAKGYKCVCFFYQNEQPRCVTKHLSVLHN